MRTWLLAGLFAMAMTLGAFHTLPVCNSVNPESAKKGQTITVKGENLGKAGVAELYLSDGQIDTKVDVASETDTEIKFTIPEIKPGRYHLLILTANGESFIEQPVIITIQ